jgi:hypothetical protein
MCGGETTDRRLMKCNADERASREERRLIRPLSVTISNAARESNDFHEIQAPAVLRRIDLPLQRNVALTP